MTNHQRKLRPHATPRPPKAKQEPPAVNYYLAKKRKTLRYDYGQIAEDLRAQVQEAAVEIKKRQRQAAIDLLAIGGCLNEVKAILPHGKFEEWVQVEFGYGLRMTQELMAVARRFDPEAAQNEDLAVRVLAMLHDKSAQNALLGPSVIRLLGAKSVPDSAIEEVLAMAETGDEPVEVAQVRAVIAEHKQMLPPKPHRPKQLPGTGCPLGPAEPETITAEYSVIPKDEFIFPAHEKRGDEIQPIISRALGLKLQDAVLHRILKALLTPDEQNELLVALTRALELKP